MLTSDLLYLAPSTLVKVSTFINTTFRWLSPLDNLFDFLFQPMLEDSLGLDYIGWYEVQAGDQSLPFYLTGMICVNMGLFGALYFWYQLKLRILEDK